MSNGTYNDLRQVYQAIEKPLASVKALQFSPAGLSFPVPAHRGRSCSTRSWAMNLARSAALHSAQKPTIPPTHEQSGLREADSDGR